MFSQQHIGESIIIIVASNSILLLSTNPNTTQKNFMFFIVGLYSVHSFVFLSPSLNFTKSKGYRNKRQENTIRDFYFFIKAPLLLLYLAQNCKILFPRLYYMDITPKISITFRCVETLIPSGIRNNFVIVSLSPFSSITLYPPFVVWRNDCVYCSELKCIFMTMIGNSGELIVQCQQKESKPIDKKNSRGELLRLVIQK